MHYIGLRFTEDSNVGIELSIAISTDDSKVHGDSIGNVETLSILKIEMVGNAFDMLFFQRLKIAMWGGSHLLKIEYVLDVIAMCR